jgi:electron transport complex protein RnfD
MHDEKKTLLVTPSPHVFEGTRSSIIMWSVSASLLPALVWGIIVFGLPALITVTLCIVSALGTELIVNVIRRRFTLNDGSAFLTGFLLGLSLPPSVPVYVPVTASIFALALVKHAFGGLGANWMNPALAGRVFALFSFSKVMNVWQVPATLPHWPAVGGAVDTVTGASPLSMVKSGLLELSYKAGSFDQATSPLQYPGGPIPLLAAKHYPITPFDSQISDSLGGLFGVHINKGYFDLFFGNAAGSIGEISLFLLLAGALFLFLRKIISWEIPVVYLGSFGILVWIFGGLPFTHGLFRGDVLFHLLTGGLVFGAFFMATDYVTTPMSRSGKIIFGAGAGFLTFLIRFTGALPEGVSLAIIIMNMFVPLIDRFMKPKISGAMVSIPDDKVT